LLAAALAPVGDLAILVQLVAPFATALPVAYIDNALAVGSASFSIGTHAAQVAATVVAALLVGAVPHALGAVVRLVTGVDGEPVARVGWEQLASRECSGGIALIESGGGLQGSEL